MKFEHVNTARKKFEFVFGPYIRIDMNFNDLQTPQNSIVQNVIK